jgi:predicted permease
MPLLRNIASGIRSLFQKKRADRELKEELRGFMEMAAEESMKQGRSQKGAHRAVRLERGSVEAAKERVRSAGWESLLETSWQDLCYGLRMLRKSPGFAAIAVLTLALGIGANTAIFTVLDGLVLRDLPVPHPEQLVHFGAHPPGDNYPSVSLPMFEEITRDQKVFSNTFAWWGDGVFNAQANGQFSHADIWAVTGNFYSELDAIPEIGRLIEPADVDLNAAAPVRVAVLGYHFWQRMYGGSRDVLGKTVRIEDVPFTIIGVTRKEFTGMDADSQPEITVPLTAEPLIGGDTDVQKHLQRRDVLWLDAGARLRPGVTIGQARAELDSLWPAIRQAVMPVEQSTVARANFASLQMKVEPYATGFSALRGPFAHPVYVLLAISGMVLLLGCVNLASLLLSRAAARSHEFGVRVALGATRARLTRQMLTESIMISIAGTLAGFALAAWGSRALSSFILGEIYYTPGALNLSPDLRIMIFTVVTAFSTGIFFGLAPAWGATREDPNVALQQGSRTLGRGTGKLGKSLIVTQIALSLILVAGAGLFIRTFQKLRAVQPGFRIYGVLEVKLFPQPNAFKNADPISYFRDLTDRISSLPGVTSAGMGRVFLGDLQEWRTKVQVHGESGTPFRSDGEMVTPGFFRTESISLLRGRTFCWSDSPKAPHVAVITENLAEKLFPHEHALGQRIDLPDEPKWQNVEIVGVVGNASLYNIRKPPQPTVFIPTMQYTDETDVGYGQLLLRTNATPAVILPEVRSVLASAGREVLFSARPLSQSIEYRALLREYISAVLSAFFGALALLIAGVGLFGLMAYNVTQRTREIGIRVALGAQRGAVLRMVLRETLILTLIGVAVGLPCVLAATRFIAHMLFGVKPYDLTTLVIVTAVLLVVGALAGYIPARRAMKVDPMVALRYE